MKPTLMRIANWLLYVGFCLLIGTGWLLEFRLPPGSRGLELLGWSRHDWGDLHFWTACAVVALAIAHLALNWAWVRKVAHDNRRWRMVVGFGVGLALIAAFILLPITRRGGRGGAGDDTHQHGGAAGLQDQPS